MNLINFNIDNWEALSPGLATNDDWVDWSNNHCQWPETITPAPANLIKPIVRRRMSSLSKLALQVSLQLTEGQDIDYIIFSSRHGELTRTVKLIEEIIAGQDASPMAFSQSVHNTSAGLFTINAKRATPVTSVAAVESSLHHALIEAAAYLHEHQNHKVLVVDFDEPLPEQYQQYEALSYNKQPYQGFAFAALLSAGDSYQLSWQESEANQAISFPETLSVIDFLLKKQKNQTIQDSRFCWRWSAQ